MKSMRAFLHPFQCAAAVRAFVKGQRFSYDATAGAQECVVTLHHREADALYTDNRTTAHGR